MFSSVFFSIFLLGGLNYVSNFLFQNLICKVMIIFNLTLCSSAGFPDALAQIAESLGRIGRVETSRGRILHLLSLRVDEVH